MSDTPQPAPPAASPTLLQKITATFQLAAAKAEDVAKEGEAFVARAEAEVSDLETDFPTATAIIKAELPNLLAKATGMGVPVAAIETLLTDFAALLNRASAKAAADATAA